MLSTPFQDHEIILPPLLRSLDAQHQGFFIFPGKLQNRKLTYTKKAANSRLFESQDNTTRVILTRVDENNDRFGRSILSNLLSRNQHEINIKVGAAGKGY